MVMALSIVSSKSLAISRWNHKRIALKFTRAIWGCISSATKHAVGIATKTAQKNRLCKWGLTYCAPSQLRFKPLIWLMRTRVTIFRTWPRIWFVFWAEVVLSLAELSIYDISMIPVFIFSMIILASSLAAVPAEGCMMFVLSGVRFSNSFTFASTPIATGITAIPPSSRGLAAVFTSDALEPDFLSVITTRTWQKENTLKYLTSRTLTQYNHFAASIPALITSVPIRVTK